MRVGLPLDALLPGASDSNQPDPATQKELSAAKDFESLLIGQMLRSVREEVSGWLGTGDDEAGATALSLGEEELAKSMAAAGGFGLAKIIASGLSARTPTAAPDNN
jgi:Rod binding domain-containing protein